MKQLSCRTSSVDFVTGSSSASTHLRLIRSIKENICQQIKIEREGGINVINPKVNDGGTTLALVDRGDFLLLVSLPWTEFLIGLNVSTSLL